jgi:predicted amidohydrolase
MIVDPLGEIIYLRNKEEDIFTYTLQKEKVNEVRNHFPFLDDADSFVISE